MTNSDNTQLGFISRWEGGLPTAVSVDELRVNEADFEVVEHGRLVEVAERREVIFAHQDVGVSQVRQVLRLGVQLVLNVLGMIRKPGTGEL